MSVSARGVAHAEQRWWTAQEIRRTVFARRWFGGVDARAVQAFVAQVAAQVQARDDLIDRLRRDLDQMRADNERVKAALRDWHGVHAEQYPSTAPTDTAPTDTATGRGYVPAHAAPDPQVVEQMAVDHHDTWCRTLREQGIHEYPVAPHGHDWMVAYDDLPDEAKTYWRSLARAELAQPADQAASLGDTHGLLWTSRS